MPSANRIHSPHPYNKIIHQANLYGRRDIVAAGYDLSLDSEQLDEDDCVALIQKLLPLFT